MSGAKFFFSIAGGEVGSRSLLVDTAISEKVPIFRDISDAGKQGQRYRDREQSDPQQ